MGEGTRAPRGAAPRAPAKKRPWNLWGLPSPPQKLRKPASRFCDLEDPLFNQGPWSLWDRAGDKEELKMVGSRLRGNQGHPCPDPLCPSPIPFVAFCGQGRLPETSVCYLGFVGWWVDVQTAAGPGRDALTTSSHPPETSPPLPSASGASCRAAGHLGGATRRGINHYWRGPRPGAAGGGCCPRFRPGHKS